MSLGGRCFYLQYFKANHYRELSLKQQRGKAISKAQRGAILDSRGRVLAASNKRQTIFAEPRAIKDIKRAFAEGLFPNPDDDACYNIRTMKALQAKGYAPGFRGGATIRETGS